MTDKSKGAPGNISSEKLLAFHYEMLRLRIVDETIADRYSEQEMRCPVHLSVGQEAVAVGACQALSGGDKVYSNHRSHYHYLAKGGDLTAMICEMYGKAAGCIGGRGGSMHLMDASKGMMLSVPIVASSIPLAVGSALADQRSGRDNVTLAFFGDGAIEEGVFHESANFAVLHNLPVIFMCENNLFSVYTPIAKRQPDRPLTDLARAHGMRTATGDGNDVATVYNMTVEAVAQARRGEGPTFLLFDTYRWLEHCGPGFDNDTGYREESEFLSWRENCPIEKARAKLMRSGDLQPDQEKAKIDQFQKEVDAVIEFAKSAPEPNPADKTLHVYA